MKNLLEERSQARWSARMNSPANFASFERSMEASGAKLSAIAHHISGSLQKMRTTEPPRIYHYADPYAQGSDSIRVEISISALNKPPSDYCVYEFALPADDSVVTERNKKRIAVFSGRVEAVVGATAFVTLVNDETGESVESQCEAEILNENGIKSGDEFVCEVVRTREGAKTIFAQVEPRQLSPSEQQDLKREFGDRWTF